MQDLLAGYDKKEDDEIVTQLLHAVYCLIHWDCTREILFSTEHERFTQSIMGLMAGRNPAVRKGA